MKWIGQHIVDLIAKFRNKVDFSDTVNFSEDVTFYQPVNNADPQISIGASDEERLQIFASYTGTSSQTMQQAMFVTHTASGTAHDGMFTFIVDGATILDFKDAGINLRAGMGVGINGIDILTDNGSGAATLSNIDALDSTTISTLNAALTAGDITSVIAGTGLSGGGTEGDVTLNLKAIQPDITTLAGVTTMGATGVNLVMNYDNAQWYNAVNNGNPQLSIGSGDNERLVIWPKYDSGAQTLDRVVFGTYAASGSANKGHFQFEVDETTIVGIKDAGLDLAANMGISINGTDILTDSSGTATLSNIDALDATTEATIEAAIDIAHLSGAEIFTSPKTFATPIISDGNRNLISVGDGAAIHVDAFDVTNGTTSASGTAASFKHVSIENPRLAASNSSVTTTDAATLYIKGAPIASTNQTITNAYALWVDDGNARFDGNIDLEGDIDVNGTLETDALTVGGTNVLSIKYNWSWNNWNWRLARNNYKDSLYW